MKRIVMCLLLAVALGCGEKGPEMPARPPIDQTTPDRTVKSLWALDEWFERCQYAENQENLKHSVLHTANMRQRSLTDIAKRLAEPGPTDRFQIQKVEIESPTRAVVWTAEPWRKDDTTPLLKQYILANEKNKWVVDEILMRCLWCKGTGMETDTDTEYAMLAAGIFPDHPPERPCTRCNSKGWTSIFDD